MTRPHIVLIPGAWHSAECYDVLIPYLTNSGYLTTALTLPSVGAEPPLKSFEPEIEYIRNAIIPLLDDGQDVVIVMHSYGGQPGSAALRGLSKSDRQAQSKHGGVTALVYLTAWMLDEGFAIRASGGGKGGKMGPTALKEEGDYIWCVQPVPLLYSDVDAALAEKAASHLKHHSLPLFFLPQSYAAWRHIPTVYLLCSNDRTIPIERQTKLVDDARAAGAKIITYTCDAGHSPFLSQPELTSKAIRRAAGEDIDVS